jgi:hypothetical protein
MTNQRARERAHRSCLLSESLVEKKCREKTSFLKDSLSIPRHEFQQWYYYCYQSKEWRKQLKIGLCNIFWQAQIFFK